ELCQLALLGFDCGRNRGHFSYSFFFQSAVSVSCFFMLQQIKPPVQLAYRRFCCFSPVSVLGVLRRNFLGFFRLFFCRTFRLFRRGLARRPNRQRFKPESAALSRLAGNAEAKAMAD